MLQDLQRHQIYLTYILTPMVWVQFSLLIMDSEPYHRVSGDISLLQTPKRKSEDKFKIWRKNTRAIFWSVGFFHQNHVFRHGFRVKS